MMSHDVRGISLGSTLLLTVPEEDVYRIWSPAAKTMTTLQAIVALILITMETGS